MSITRQRRRAMRRKMGGISDAQAEKVILAIREQTEERKRAANNMTAQVSHEVYERIKKRYMPELQAHAAGEILTMVAAFLHIDRRHTGPFLRKWIHQFNEFADDLKAGGATTAELQKILRDECKLDLVEEFRLCEEETLQRAKEKGRVSAF